MLIYLARPIDAAKEDPKVAYQHFAEDLLGGLSPAVPLVMYLPAPAFVVNGHIDHETAMQLVAINEAALEVCDIVVAEHNPGVSSYGVPQEIMRANENGKTILILSQSAGYWDLPVNLKACVIEEHVFRVMEELQTGLIALLADGGL